MKKIKLVCCDIDGTLTDGTVFYSERGEELKQFSHRDGRAFHLIQEKTGGKVRVALITSEEGGINEQRAKKFLRLGTIVAFYQGSIGKYKLEAVTRLCERYGVDIREVLFIGDDTNDIEALEGCGYCACPSDAVKDVKEIDGIMVSDNLGGRGAVRDIINRLLNQKAFEGQEG